MTALLFVSVLVVVVLGVGAVSGPAEALFPIDNFTAIDETATVGSSGHEVVVTGTVSCTAGEIATVQATVRQDGVEATGQTHVRCLGGDVVQRWTIHAIPRDSPTFEPGDAHVWAEARTYTRGELTDEFLWDEAVELVGR